jgi:hypothetical protein
VAVSRIIKHVKPNEASYLELQEASTSAVSNLNDLENVFPSVRNITTTPL